MKRSKQLTVFVFAVVLLFGITGCNQKVRLAAYTVFKQGEQKAVWNEKNPDDYSAPDQMTVTVNGVQYTGEYRGAERGFPDSYNIEHTYAGDDFTFSIKDGSEDLTFFFNNLDGYSTCAFDQENCRKIANSIADDYIKLKEYEVAEFVDEYSTKHYHRYEYYKKISGYKTEDSVFISLNCEGRLKSVKLVMTGSLDNVKSVWVDNGRLNTAIQERLTAVIADYNPDFSLTGFDITELVLFRLENGQCALRTDVSYSYKSINEEEPRSSHTRYYVVVDHQKRNPFKP